MKHCIKKTVAWEWKKLIVFFIYVLANCDHALVGAK